MGNLHVTLWHVLLRRFDHNIYLSIMYLLHIYLAIMDYFSAIFVLYISIILLKAATVISIYINTLIVFVVDGLWLIP